MFNFNPYNDVLGGTYVSDIIYTNRHDTIMMCKGNLTVAGRCRFVELDGLYKVEEYK